MQQSKPQGRQRRRLAKAKGEPGHTKLQAELLYLDKWHGLHALLYLLLRQVVPGRAVLLLPLPLLAGHTHTPRGTGLSPCKGG
jgi:hypothetical protein